MCGKKAGGRARCKSLGAWFEIERVEGKREGNRSVGAREAEICAHVTCEFLAKGFDLGACPLIDSPAAEDLGRNREKLVACGAFRNLGK